MDADETVVEHGGRVTDVGRSREIIFPLIRRQESISTIELK